MNLYLFRFLLSTLMKQNLIALCCYLILLRRLEAVEVDQGPVEVVPGVALQKRTFNLLNNKLPYIRHAHT